MTDGKRAFVLGHPVRHTRSPLVHRHWLETLGLQGSYEPIDLTPEALGPFLSGLAAEGFAGGNVTVPHKVATMPYMDRLDEAARAIGAVNTIWREDGATVGGNTDAAGLIANLDEHAPGWEGPAVVLGAGGAARAAVYALRQRHVAIRLVNRTEAHAEAIAERAGGVTVHGWDALPDLLGEAGLLLNTTSLGMSGKPPLEVDLAPLRRRAVVYDIVYVPLETGLLRAARAHKLRTVDGLGMLLHQAVPGFARWFGVTPTVTPTLRALVEADILG